MDARNKRGIEYIRQWWRGKTSSADKSRCPTYIWRLRKIEQLLRTAKHLKKRKLKQKTKKAIICQAIYFLCTESVLSGLCLSNISEYTQSVRVENVTYIWSYLLFGLGVKAIYPLSELRWLLVGPNLQDVVVRQRYSAAGEMLIDDREINQSYNESVTTSTFRRKKSLTATHWHPDSLISTSYFMQIVD